MSTLLHMGHGQTIALAARGPDVLELLFSDAGKPDAPAPPINSIKVEVIDDHGVIHPLTISSGNTARAVLATGQVSGAYRARVMVRHGDHFHTRESLLPGKAAIVPRRGSHGGVVMALAHETVEVTLASPDTFELRFSGTVPAPDAVVVQAIGPSAEDYQIRNLTVRAGDGAGMLIATGKIRDAAYVRVTLKSGANATVRSMPIVR